MEKSLITAILMFVATSASAQLQTVTGDLSGAGSLDASGNSLILGTLPALTADTAAIIGYLPPTSLAKAKIREMKGL